MQRFFITPNAIHDDLVQFPEAIARQMEKVLRLDLMNDEVIVLDNSGNSYLVRLNGRQAGILHGVILQITETNPRTGLKLELGFSLTKREKVEWILQKATELGVSVFRPFVSERSLDRGLTLGTPGESAGLQLSGRLLNNLIARNYRNCTIRSLFGTLSTVLRWTASDCLPGKASHRKFKSNPIGSKTQAD